MFLVEGSVEKLGLHELGQVLPVVTENIRGVPVVRTLQHVESQPFEAKDDVDGEPAAASGGEVRLVVPYRVPAMPEESPVALLGTLDDGLERLPRLRPRLATRG